MWIDVDPRTSFLRSRIVGYLIGILYDVTPLTSSLTHTSLAHPLNHGRRDAPSQSTINPIQLIPALHQSPNRACQ
jgi:hypothetical protein